MRICSIQKIPQKAKLAKPVYDHKGILLLNKGIDITESITNKFKANNIYFIYIEDDISEGIEVESIIDDETKAMITFSIKNIIDNVSSGKKTNAMLPIQEIKKVENIVDTLLKNIKEKNELSYMAVELMGTDMNTYTHSVNVAILSIVNSIDYGYADSMCEKIGFGALMHDIGKTRIDNHVLQKHGILSHEEFNLMKMHPTLGYKMLKSDPSISSISKSIILNHHEKLDGTGYPSGLTASQMPDFLRIVTLSDMFDAMTTDRVYRRRIPVHLALENLMADCISKLDAKIYNRFVRNVILYPPGSMVMLNEGTVAIVSEYNKLNPTRPKLRIVDSKNYSYQEEIDLMQVLNLLIKYTID